MEFLRRRKREAQDKKEAEKRNRLAKMSGQSMPISASKTVQRVEAMDHTGSDCCHNDVSFVYFLMSTFSYLFRPCDPLSAQNILLCNLTKCLPILLPTQPGLSESEQTKGCDRG